MMRGFCKNDALRGAGPAGVVCDRKGGERVKGYTSLREFSCGAIELARAKHSGSFSRLLARRIKVRPGRSMDPPFIASLDTPGEPGG